MIIRKIKPEELKRTNELFGISFNTSIDNAKTPMQTYQDAISSPKSREDAYCLEKWAAFEDDDKTMMSFLMAQPFYIHFDGHFCSMRGIGGVSTLPHYRRKGGIRACFSHALTDMYQNNVLFSFLYPFSTAYYRKFGYEICCERFKYTIPLDSIPNRPMDGSCLLSEKQDEHFNDIRAIYEAWMHTYNFMVKNETFEYSRLTAPNPAKNQEFTYIYKDNRGKAKGFMRYKIKTDQNKQRILICQRFLFIDKEGFHGLMQLAKNFAGDHYAIQFELPSNINITPLLPEWCLNSGKCEKNYCGMARAINVKEILTLAKYKGSGRLTLNILDPLLPKNNDCFLVTFADNKAVDVGRTDMLPDITMTINDFSRLIIGAGSTDDFTYMESVRTNAKLEQISKVFYPKPNLILEYF